MATQIILKKSSVVGAIPLTTDLEIGEVALNLADRKLYSKNNSGTVVQIGSPYVSGTAPSSPAEGDLWYDSTNDLLKSFNGTSWVSAGYSTLSALEDVTITSIASGEILKWDGSGWINNTLSEAGIAASSHTHTLSDITDVTATAAELNYVSGVTSSIQTQLDGKASSSHTHAIDALSDVTITTVADNELLAYDTTTAKWINQTPAEAGFAAVATSGAYSDLSGTPTIGDATVTISAGVGLATGGTFTTNQTANSTITLTLDLNELTTSVADGDGDYFAVVDSLGAQKKLTKANINLSGFNNDSGFITSYTETDTLATVTGRGATTGTALSITNVTGSTSDSTGALVVTGGVGIGENLYVGGNTIITGNLTVNGTTTAVNSNEVNIGDSIILLNADETAAPTQDAGFTIERGTSTNVSFLWNETSDYWSLGGETLGDVIIDGGTY